jgi:hypothetical protein
MPVESLGEALSYGWRVTARCAAGKQEGMTRHPDCRYREELDMSTLVWTRGRSSVVTSRISPSMPPLRVARRGAPDHDPTRDAGNPSAELMRRGD